MPAIEDISLDLSDIATRDTLHAKLASAFAFPSYYGRNWDAFWDCICCNFKPPARITISGMDALRKTLPREAALLEKCMRDYQAKPFGKDVAVDFK